MLPSPIVYTPWKIINTSCYGEQQAYVYLQPFTRWTSQQQQEIWANAHGTRKSL